MQLLSCFSLSAALKTGHKHQMSDEVLGVEMFWVAFVLLGFPWNAPYILEL